jgi:hypothetical integral membrane protein (TIGR02206 family)
VVSAISLLTKRQLPYELAYFWGLGGSVQALITPALAADFPTYEFFRYFISHGGIVAAVSYLTLGRGRRPLPGAVGRAILVTAAYLIAVSGINALLSSNYLFVCRKPPDPTLLDLLGDWPWYIVPLCAVGVLTIAILYIPYYIADRHKAGEEQVADRP